jgi:CheY-like chemotaxis protein
MKILVIDDSPIHQASARQTLKGHDLTIAMSYEEGFNILTPLSYMGYVKKGEKGAEYDVVLSDLLMPASGTMMANPEEFVGQEQPLGWALLLRAVLNAARYAALVSQTSHHDHPAAFALDAIDNADDAWDPETGQQPKMPQFVINGARVGFFHAPMCLVQGFPGCAWKCDQGKDSRGEPCKLCGGSGLAHGKDWGKVLACLLEG